MKAQIWVETVIYTLIAFVMIGLVLSFIRPKIEQVRDEAIIEETIRLMEDLDNIILSVRDVTGNQRLIDMNIKKGVLNIDGIKNQVDFKMESAFTYSQPGEDVLYGDIVVRTMKKTGDLNVITLVSNYSKDYDIQYKEENKLMSLTQSPTPYRTSVSNKGINASKIIINLEVI